MAPLIPLGAGTGPAPESAPAQPSDAHVPLGDAAGLVFPPLEPQPLPLPEGVEPALQVEPAPVPDEPSLDPQQWLSAMLGQQAVQLQVRDYTAARPGGSAPAPGVERLLSRLPMQADAVVLGQESFDPAEQKSPPGKAWPGAHEGFAAPAESKAAALLNALPQVHPASRALAAMLADPAGGREAASPQAPLPGTAAAQEPLLERGLRLTAPQARWGEQMLHALRETVQVQVQQRFQQATIRLDPPELGSLEIFISHEPGRLSVQISAAQGDVARLLQHTSDRLRQELVGQNTLQVNVQISGDAQGHAGRDSSRQRHEPAIAEAVQDAQDATQSSRHRSSDVLVTV
jgi:flagellar hook-length control protein FliK